MIRVKKINLSLFPAKSPKIRWIEQRCVIILNPETGIYHKLNQTASFIWQLSNGTRSIDGICNLLVKKYNVNKDKARADALGIIKYLQKAGAVELFGSPADFYPLKKKNEEKV